MYGQFSVSIKYDMVFGSCYKQGYFYYLPALTVRVITELTRNKWFIQVYYFPERKMFSHPSSGA